MQQIPLQIVPNQKFSIVLDGNNWDIDIRLIENAMAMSLTLNNTVIISNAHLAAGARIIPSSYEEAGNFIFATLNQQLPDYTQFGITQTLIYFSAAELASIRGPSPSKITASDFDPLGALPLRFSPQGYVLS